MEEEGEEEAGGSDDDDDAAEEREDREVNESRDDGGVDEGVEEACEDGEEQMCCKLSEQLGGAWGCILRWISFNRPTVVFSHAEQEENRLPVPSTGGRAHHPGPHDHGLPSRRSRPGAPSILRMSASTQADGKLQACNPGLTMAYRRPPTANSPANRPPTSSLPAPAREVLVAPTISRVPCTLNTSSTSWS